MASAPIAAGKEDWIEPALASLRDTRVAVFGDFCLDCYWTEADAPDEVSLETGKPVWLFGEHRAAPGGAGNVVANLRALGVGSIAAVGLRGDDLFGRELAHGLAAADVDVSALLVAAAPWHTPVYLKPIRGGEEQNRMDLGAGNRAGDAEKSALVSALRRAAASAGVVVINQQLRSSFYDRAFIAEINRIIADHPGTVFVVDSRDLAAEFRGAVLKLNLAEARRYLGDPEGSANDRPARDEAAAIALAVAGRTGCPVLVTCGERGLCASDGTGVHYEPGIQILEKSDPVGAGDTVVAVLAAMLGAGQPLERTAFLANCAAAVTLRQVRTTGTASPEAILRQARTVDYVHHPELAADPRRARHLPGTAVEIVAEYPRTRPVSHVIFDHDGTISVLRRGWEKIMEPMMVRAVFGKRAEDAPRRLYEQVTEDVRAFIDRTTGIQTLAQMQGLVALVREHGLVPADEVLDEHGYKAVYNEALLDMVRRRVRRIEAGELEPADHEVKGAIRFLGALRRAGVTIYLASGTDRDDVVAEATVMGYADLFDGGIYGATTDVNVEAKRMVLERIMSGGHLGGDALAVFGDGPVEIREGRRRGALCVGLASDELVRHGLDEGKRHRLIRAGAHAVIADFSQPGAVLSLLGLDARDAL